MGRDNPPQTIHQALEFGWTHLSITCRCCRHEGQIGFEQHILRRPGSLYALFGSVVCAKCGTRPTTASLAFKLAGDRWHTKRVDFFEGMVIRPSRE
ncbi:hypothetical protein [Labrys neptuniae]